MADHPSSDSSARAPSTTAPRRGRRTLLVIAAIGLAPVIASYLAYYVFPRESKTNYGTLLSTNPAPAFAGTRLDGALFRLSDLHGQWVLLVADAARCNEGCQRKLYATRQARTMQGREQERIARLWLVTDDATPDPALLAQHHGLIVARVAPSSVIALPGGADAVYLIDPLGNLVLRYSDSPDIAGINRDLDRLLKASRIG